MDLIFSSMYFSTHPLVLHISTSYCNIHTEHTIHALRAADKYKERSQYLSHVVDSHQGEAHVPPPVFIGSRCPNITICSISGLDPFRFPVRVRVKRKLRMLQQLRRNRFNRNETFWIIWTPSPHTHWCTTRHHIAVLRHTCYYLVLSVIRGCWWTLLLNFISF